MTSDQALAYIQELMAVPEEDPSQPRALGPYDIPRRDFDYLVSKNILEHVSEGHYHSLVHSGGEPIDFERIAKDSHDAWVSRKQSLDEFSLRLEQAKRRYSQLNWLRWLAPHLHKEHRTLQAELKELQPQFVEKDCDFADFTDLIWGILPHNLRYTRERMPFKTTERTSELLHTLFGARKSSGCQFHKFRYGSYDFELLLQYPSKPVIIPVVARYGPDVALDAYQRLTRWLKEQGWSWETGTVRAEPVLEPARCMIIDDPLMSLAGALARKTAYTFQITEARTEPPTKCEVCLGTGHIASSTDGDSSACVACGGTGSIEHFVPPTVRIITRAEF
jgi:hypothetical protein